MRWADIPRSRREWIVTAATIAVVMLILVAFMANAGRISPFYLTNVILVMAIFAIFALGLSVEFGYAGLLNFGHVAFMGLGAYGMAVFSLRWQATLAPALQGGTVGGILACALLAILAGVVSLVPILFLVQGVARRATERTRLRAAIIVAALVAVGTMAASFPLSDQGARNMVTLLGIVVGLALAAVVALVLGFPAIRLREDYLAIVMIGSAEILRAFASNEEWLTRGTLGILNLQRPVVDWATQTPWWDDMADAVGIRPVALAHAILALLILAYVFLLLETLAKSPWGRVLKAIREDEDVAAALGKNVALYKLQALMLGSAIAAIAGVLLAWHTSAIFPDDFAPLLTFYAFIILVMGGVGNHKGAILGSVLLWAIFEISGNLTFLAKYGIEFAGPLQAMFIGLLLVLVMMFRPQGAVGRKEEMALGK